MNVKSVEDKRSPAPDVTDSPRKKMRLDSSSRKSWSLMDRKTDTDVLQEMGVSLLEPDDSENHCDSTSMHKSSLKRKHDIENVNPNINIGISPTSRKLCSPGPSKRSPRSCDKAKPLQPAEAADEDTPLAQCVGAGHKPCELRRAAGGAQPAASPCSPRPLRPPSPHSPSAHSPSPSSLPPSSGASSCSFSMLADECVLAVLRWLPKRALANCALINKRFYRLSCDETLWQRLDLGNKTLARDALGKILDRKPVIVRLASSEIGDWQPASPPVQSRLQYLDLSMSSISTQTLRHLLERCGGLRKLSLESVGLCEDCQMLIGKCRNLETLNLAMARGVTARGLAAVLGGCGGLQSLNISWCNLSEEALEVAVSSLPPNLQRLNISGARALTDDMMSSLVSRCPRLRELDASDCALLGARALRAIAGGSPGAGGAGGGGLRRLEHLALSRCYLLPPAALPRLAALPALRGLELWGLLQAAALGALRAALPAVQLNQFMFSAVARPTVGARRTSLWGLRTRD